MKRLLLVFFGTFLVYYSFSQSYHWDRFGQGNVSMTANSPVTGIYSNTTQASGTSTYYLVEADAYWNKWSNTSTPFNQEFTLTWGGGSYNGPDGILSNSTTSGKYYTLQILGASYSNRTGVIMETSNSPISFHASTPISPSSPNVFPGQDLEITVALSGNKSTEEKAFVRYSDDSYITSFLAEVSFGSSTASSGTATIPGSFNTSGKSVSFYVYSTTVSATTSSNHDLITLNIANNSGSNYSYTVNSSWTTSNGSTNFNDAAAWDAGEVPPTGQPITIDDDITLNTDYTASSLTINTSKTFTNSNGTNAYTLTIVDGGTLTNNGTFLGSDGTVSFAGSGTVSGTISFNDVSISGGVNFGSSSTIGANLTINSGGYIDSNTPTFGGSSTLIYNTGGTFGRSLEWSATSGAGYPNNVTISNSTTVDLSNNGVGTARQIAGNLTINSGSALTMDEMTASLTVIGDITNSGTLTLSSAVSGDLNIGGNLTNTGTFTSNSRAINFSGSSQQTISNNLSTDYFTVNNASGIILNADLTIGNTLTLTNGVIDLQGGKISISSGASVSGGSSTSYIKTSSNHGLVQEVANGSPKTYPVGNSSYNPVTISNSGTTDNFTVLVADEVLDGGTSGSALTDNVVDRTWTITEGSAGGSNVSVTFQWNASDELGTFNRSNCFPSHYNGSYWKPGTSASASGSNPYSISITGIESFSPFSIGSGSSPLPVDLIEFKGTHQYESITLTWTTLSEINNSHFEIEKSFNGKEFDFLGKVNGNGTTNATTNYSFIDNAEVKNEVFYRLKQVDLDGNFEYSEVIVAKDMESSSELDVFPNPTKGLFNIQFKEITPKTIKVRNSFGVLVNEFKIGGILQTQLDLTNQPKGLYFIEVSSEYSQEFIPLMISR